MHEYGCIQARVDGIELTINPTFQRAAATSLEEKPAAPTEKIVSGDEKREPRINPLLRHKSLGLGPLLTVSGGEKQVAP